MTVQGERPRVPADRGLVPSRATRNACIAAVLRMAGLRPTSQRLGLASLLLAGQHRHVSADGLYEEARAAGMRLSLATVYNTLHQFRSAGLVRTVAIDAARTYFDTDTSNHHHFYLEDEERVVDIPPDALVVQGLPSAPGGMVVTHVDVVIRVRRSGLR